MPIQEYGESLLEYINRHNKIVIKETFYFNGGMDSTKDGEKDTALTINSHNIGENYYQFARIHRANKNYRHAIKYFLLAYQHGVENAYREAIEMQIDYIQIQAKTIASNYSDKMLQLFKLL